MSNSHYVLPQYINPQHTDKLYNDHQLEHCFSTPRASNGLPSPFLTTPTSNTRGLTLELSDASTYVSEPSSASSMGSSPGYLTPCSSSNASSRRQSLIVPESQQCFLSSVAQAQTSPTPGPRRTGTRQHVEQIHSPLSASFSSYSDSLCSATNSLGSESFPSGVASNDLLMNVDMYQNKSNSIDWQYPDGVSDHTTGFDQGLQMNVPCLSMDLAAGFNASMTGQMGLPRQTVENPSMAAFNSVPNRQRGIMPSQVQHTHVPALAEPFEPLSHLSDRSSRSLSPPFTSSPGYRGRPGVNAGRRSKTSKKSEPKWREHLISCHPSSNNHKCAHCEHSFKRPEHLKRHERKHLPPEQTNMLPCFFAECTRKIKDRPDNMRAHLQVTHFKYGKTERGGKNRRFSMKDSMEMNLKSEDARWTQLLEGGIVFGDTETGYWKMLGYSIKETQEMKVKDLVPEWEGPNEVTLKEFDPRWKQLLDGDMTFEQAMERGRWMPEEEKEGLLGVDMTTSKAMGLQDVDPRWTKLLEGSMSIETSEKLGVKHLNSAAIEQQADGMKSEL